MTHLEVLKRLPKEKEGEIPILNIIEGVQGDDPKIDGGRVQSTMMTTKDQQVLRVSHRLVSS